MSTMDVEFEKRCASSLSSSSSSSASEEEERVDRLVETEEIEAAETLAQLAMRQIDSAEKWCTKRDSTRVTRESPTLHSDPSPSPLAIGGQAVAGQQLDEKKSPTTDIETESIQQNDCLGHMKVDQEADLPKTTSYSSVRCNKSRRNLTEEEKEARRIRRVLANRESARQTIRRRQALSEELTRKAATLVVENENLKKEKELALKEYHSLETTNRQLKAQIAKSINTEVEKTPVEQESSVAEVTPVSGSSPWFLYNHFPVTQLFWPSILQSSNPVQLQHTPFNSIAIPPNVYVPPSESESCHKQNNLINDNRTQNPLYMFPCPWLYPLPEYGNGRSPPSSGHKQDKLPLGKQCSTALSLNTMANVDYQAALPIKLKTEARSIDDSGCATLSFSSDGGEQKTGGHIIEKFHGQAFGCNGHASAVKQEPELQLHSAPSAEVSSSTASHIATSSVEKKQEQFICPGKNLVDAVAAAEARKRRKELTKLKGIQNRQSRMEC